MDVKINGNLSDISAMLLNAERYALGRQTYIVEWTTSFISKNMHLLTESNKKIMIRDIEQCENYGADFDKKEWMSLLNKLKALLEIEERGVKNSGRTNNRQVDHND